jgi:hypothetical protein
MRTSSSRARACSAGLSHEPRSPRRLSLAAQHGRTDITAQSSRSSTDEAAARMTSSAAARQDESTAGDVESALELSRAFRRPMEGHPDLHRKGNASRLYRAGGHCQLEMWTNSTVRPAGLRRATKRKNLKSALLVRCWCVPAANPPCSARPLRLLAPLLQALLQQRNPSRPEVCIREETLIRFPSCRT